VRHEKYYIPGQPAFDELVLRIIPDAAARVAAFEKGEVDMLYNQFDAVAPRSSASRNFPASKSGRSTRQWFGLSRHSST